jgi:chromosome segregation ATPase
LKEEKEAEIANYVKTIDHLKEEISSLKYLYEKQNTKKTDIDEEKKELAENLKKIQKQTKKKNEVIVELKKLGGQDLKVL